MSENMPDLHDLPSNPIPPLLRLAVETTQNIGRFLDRNDLFALGLTSRSLSYKLTSHISDRVWGELVISVPQEPKISQSPDLGERVAAYISWLREESQRRHEVWRANMGRKVGLILHKGEEENRWGMVKSIRLTPRSSSTDDLLQVLDRTSETLTGMTIVGAPLINTLGPIDYDTIDSSALGHSFSFPCLRHVRLGLNSKPHANFGMRLCAAAPQLHTLEIDWRCSDTELEPCRPRPPLHIPVFNNPTSLRRMLFTWGDDVHDGTERDMEVSVSLEVLRRSPRIQQLAILPEYMVHEGTAVQVLAAVRSLADLNDMLCGYDELVFRRWSRAARPGAAGPGPADLKRLVMRTDDWRWGDIFDMLITLPSLE